MVSTLTNSNFSPFDDWVVRTDGINVATSVTPVSAQSGNDFVSGSWVSPVGDTAPAVSGITLASGSPSPGLRAVLQGAGGNDTFEGTSLVVRAIPVTTATTAYGVRIRDYATLDAGADNDIVIGRAHGYNINYVRAISMNTGASLLTGTGNDVVKGEASGLTNSVIPDVTAAQTGIEMVDSTTIDTGSGNDVIIGRAEALAGTTGTVFGIRGNGEGSDDIDPANDKFAKILTGGGNDVVSATATIGGVRQNAFGRSSGTGRMLVDLGDGNDVVRGFGNVRLKGGSGYDVYDLRDYKFSEFTSITKGIGQVANFTIGTGSNAVTASTDGFEAFLFQDFSVPYQLLPVV